MKKAPALLDVPGLGPVPRLYVEAWAIYEAYRRLGFKDEETVMIVAPSMGGRSRIVTPNMLHVILRAQDLEYVWAVEPIDRSFAEARDLITALKTAVASGDGEALTLLYRATAMGNADGKHFARLADRLINKGFRLPALAN